MEGRTDGFEGHFEAIYGRFEAIDRRFEAVDLPSNSVIEGASQPTLRNWVNG